MKSKEIGATVRQLRTAQGKTSTDLAKKVGVSQPQISRLEIGQQGFRSEILMKIAKALKVPTFRLLMTEKDWERWKRAK